MNDRRSLVTAMLFALAVLFGFSVLPTVEHSRLPVCNFSCAAEPETKPVTSPELSELLKTFRAEFVSIAPGEGDFPRKFVMGRDAAIDDAEAPAHEVTMQQPFAIARYEVPQNLWEAVMGENPSRWKGPRNSVEMLSLVDAEAFCAKATDLMHMEKLIDDDQRVRLPSEAEWEYTARAGTDTVFSFGNDPEHLDAFGWYHGNAAGNDPPVGAKKPNAWKLYDVHGYLWEWCSDPWHDNYDGAPTDGSAWTKDGDTEAHVLRGGSWKDEAESLTSSYRRRGKSDLRDDAVGLRCVLARDKQKSKP